MEKPTRHHTELGRGRFSRKQRRCCFTRWKCGTSCHKHCGCWGSIWKMDQYLLATHWYSFLLTCELLATFLQGRDLKKEKKKDLKLPRPQSTGKFLALCCLLPSSFSSGPTEAALSRWYQPLPVQDAVCAKSRAGFSGPHGWSAHRCGIGSPLALQPAQRFEMMKSLVTLPQQLNIPFRKCSSDRQWCVMLLCVMLLFKSFTSLMC